MKIGWVIPGGVDRSGRERVIPALLWLIEEIAARCELHIFTERQYPQACEYPLLGAAVHNLGDLPAPPGAHLLRQLAALTGGLRAHGPFDALHGFWADGSGLLAALAGERLNIPVLLTLAGGELVSIPDIGYGAQRSLRGRLRVALALRIADRVSAASGPMVALAQRRGVLAQTIPLGAHPDWFAPGAARVDGPPWRLLHVASLNRVKDQPTLLRAMKQVIAAEPAARLDIVGEDTLGGEAQRLAERLGLGEFVQFHGFLPSEQVRPFMQRAHLLVVSSRHEAGPLVMIEAAACRLPCVGTLAAGHAADWQPAAACAVPPGDERALAEAIIALLRDAPRREAMGRAAQQWAQEHDSRWTARQFEHCYQSLTENKRRKP